MTDTPDPSTVRPAEPFTFLGLGGTSEVGASSHLITIGPVRVLVDAGARPSQTGLAGLPNLDLLDEQPPTTALLTHAHLDHVGMLPIVTRRFPHLKVYCTPGTALLTAHVLADSLNVQAAGGPRAQVFSDVDVRRALNALEVRPFHLPFVTEADVRVTFYPAGHLPGAAQALIETGGRKVLHCGDISNVATSVTEPAWRPDQPMNDLDAMILESTYGDTVLPTRRKQVRALIRAVGQVVRQGGKVLIPSFALGRAQELAVIFAEAIRNQTLPNVPVYLDGMTRAVTQTMEDHLELLPGAYRNAAANGVRQVLTMNLVHMVGQDRADIISRPGPAVVIASGGMLTAGVSPVYARAWLPDPKNAMMIVGYQDAESPGAKLLNLLPGAPLLLPDRRGALTPVTVRAGVTRYYLSAHADRLGLIAHARACGPKRLVLVHGERRARASLAGALNTDISTVIPLNGETSDLNPQALRVPRAFIPQVTDEALRHLHARGVTEGRVMTVNGVRTLILPLPGHFRPELIPDGTYQLEVNRAARTHLRIKELIGRPDEDDEPGKDLTSADDADDMDGADDANDMDDADDADGAQTQTP